jgi:hypothetical protein
LVEPYGGVRGNVGRFFKRDIAVIFGAIVVLCDLSAWGSIFVIKNYVIGERADLLAHAGGLKPELTVQPK